MNTSPRFHADPNGAVLWNDEELVLCRGWRLGGDGQRSAALALLPASEQPSSSCLERLAHEFELKDELVGDWAVRPMELAREGDRSRLLLEDPGGEPLERLLGRPLDIAGFLAFAIGIAAAIGKAHQRGLVHKDIKPAHIMVNCADGQVRLTGFGLASRLLRARQAPAAPETIAGTLAYMAPEQTGRMNRSIDSRSDLYSLGVTLYRMLTGTLPFTAADPVEWVHCHIARQPLTPGERLQDIPAPLSRIVMKLLAKTAEERYQSAAGVERDLQRCLSDWQDHKHIDEFALGQRDTSDRLLIPEKLYGREQEIETLLRCFDRIAAGGAPELVLVSGYSGIGKSSVVNELHKVLVLPRGLFASGKFDQYRRDIPFTTLAQAFRNLIQPLLSKSDAELADWRDSLLLALGANAGLITDLIPELKLIIGEPPPVPRLEPQQAQSRFQLVFRQFIGVFARPEHPLALFLDDLQWLDAGTIDLLEDLLTRAGMPHLMLIGAYRDNEVDATHPLIRKLDSIRRAGARVHELRLAPLARQDLQELIADALHCAVERAAPLAQLVDEKTGSNPFFVIQFLYSLAQEGLLRFEHAAQRWQWDLNRIHAKGYTDNVVDLMVGKLNRLPPETQQALRQLACVGNLATVAMLSIVLKTPEEQVHGVLWTAVREELIERLDRSYRFMHDRVQEAAYSLIPRSLRAETHLRIGRLLVEQTPPHGREEAIFDIVGQLNRGAALIEQPTEREQLAELNLIAGRRAKGSTAYASALTYFNAGAALLADDAWEQRRELTFALELNRAECEFLTGRLAAAEERLAALADRTTSTVEGALVACLRIGVCTTLDRSDRAVAVCLEFLRQVGIEWSPHPDEEEVRLEYERIWSLLRGRAIEDLIDSPLMEDPASLGTIDVLTKVHAPALFTDANLSSLLLCRAVSISLERGNCDASCVAYVWLGAHVGRHFGDYQAGYRFGELGYQLVERRGLKRFEASTHDMFAFFVSPWMKPVRAGRDLLRRAFDAANRIGDLTYGAYACIHLNANLLFAGDPLPEAQAEAEHGLAFAEKARFSGYVINRITTQLAVIRMLRGSTVKFGLLDDSQFSELATERRLSNNPALALAASGYWIRKLQARYLAGDVAAAMDAASALQRLPTSRLGVIEEAEYHFYAALAHLAHCDCAPLAERAGQLQAAGAHLKQLQVWSENCPENFQSHTALIVAEIARIEGRALDAMELYEQAIRAARVSGFVHNEALGNEAAGRFYTARGHDKIARVYLQDARYAYSRWGALGKVRQLEEMHPRLREDARAGGAAATIATTLEHLDLTTVIKVSQAVSGEIVLEKMLGTLMRTAVAQGAAERGLLILSHAAELRIAAQATTVGETILVKLPDAAVTEAVLPETILQYVLRTRESIILDDAAADSRFAADPYVRRTRARSILCLPLLNQAQLIGLLYLENNLTSRAFAPDRIAVLRLLASQAAVSLENTRLYRDHHDLHLQLARANRVLSIGELSASITHEINQPLAGIILNASTGLRMLGAEPPNINGARETLSRSIRDANRASDVIKRLRSLYAKKEAQSEPVNINELIREVVTLSMSEIERMRIQLRTELHEGLPLVMGDRVQLQQVLLNLVRNASEAMIEVEDRRKVLTIGTAHEHEAAVRVQVRDGGVGFEPHGEAKLFQAFYTTKSDGMGIGLSVSRSIIEMHRGRIWAERNEGPGATFAFSIPTLSCGVAGTSVD